jgi:two-component system chemotaxis response regulator CheB
MVLHLPADYFSALPEILSRSCSLRVDHAIHGEPVEAGRIYIAPPDRHLMLQEGSVRVVRGPKENGHRPAVDPLFRTAARAYGERVIGVVLTGALDCGTVGLLTIKSLGGLAVVQDPEEAFCPNMPRNAIEHVKVDHILPLSEIASLLARLAGEPLSLGAVMSQKKIDQVDPPGKLSAITCPECHGSLTEKDFGGLLQFRCHVGHTYSTDGMVAAQAEALETALWVSVRTLEESGMLARRVAGRSDPKIAAKFTERADEMKRHADLIREILLGGRFLSRQSASTRKRSKFNP